MSVYQHVDRESADQSQPSQLGVGRYGDQESAVISANMAIKTVSADSIDRYSTERCTNYTRSHKNID